MDKSLENYHIKKLFYLCAKRGMKETEFLLRTFAEQEMSNLTPAELNDFETLLHCTDSDILNWLMGVVSVPKAYDTGVFRKLSMFKKT